MNKFNFIAIFSLVIFSLSSCMKDSCEETRHFKVYNPVYLSYEELRSSVASMPTQKMENMGKIYLYNNWLFVNEIGKGVHVIDNIDPANPVNKGYINIPGNVDIAIKDGNLYADSYIDLVVINVNDPLNVTEVSRLEAIFPTSNWNTGFYTDPEKGLVIDYIEKDTAIVMDCNTYYQGMMWNEGDVISLDANAGGAVNAPTGSNNASTNVGLAGSLARFAIKNNNLYAINNGSLQTIHIGNPSSLVVGSSLQVGWNIETLFPYQNNLFIGSQSGVFIYNVSGNEPVYVSQLAHATSCDPVVVNGNYAYVTLRDGNTCNGFNNQLDLINISNIANPFLEYTYPMTHPIGLGIDGETLFLCDDQAGLKIFDVTDKSAINSNMIINYSNVKATDVIPYNGVLIMLADNGIFQYSYENLNDIKLISSIFEGQ